MSTTSTAKLLATLHLFAACDGRVRVGDVVQAIGVSHATAYRYLADLESAGLVSRFASGEYVLGPEISALDRAVRDHDPYLAAARPVMTDLAQSTGASISLIRLSGERLVYVLDVAGPTGPPMPPEARGRSEPMHCGSPWGSMFDRAASARRDTWRAMMPDPLGGLRWAAVIWQGRQLIGAVAAVIRATAPPDEPAQIADKVRRAALRIEGRLKAERSLPAAAAPRFSAPPPDRVRSRTGAERSPHGGPAPDAG